MHLLLVSALAILGAVSATNPRTDPGPTNQGERVTLEYAKFTLQLVELSIVNVTTTETGETPGPLQVFRCGAHP